jgi:hypothetical protein
MHPLCNSLLTLFPPFSPPPLHPLQPWPRSVGYVHSRAAPWWNLHQGDYDWGNKFPEAGVPDKPWALVDNEPWSPLFCFGHGQGEWAPSVLSADSILDPYIAWLALTCCHHFLHLEPNHKASPTTPSPVWQSRERSIQVLLIDCTMNRLYYE